MKCEKCGNILIEYREGINVNFLCPVCDETPVTQNNNLIEFDSNSYVVKILPRTEYGNEQLKKVALVCGCNVLEAKKILDGKGKILPSMDALDTRALKEKLEFMDVHYEITPRFNW